MSLKKIVTYAALLTAGYLALQDPAGAGDLLAKALHGIATVLGGH